MDILYTNGSVSYTGDFNNDKENGEWIYYDQDGRLDRKGSFTNGKPNGTWLIFDPADSVKPIFTNNWSQGISIGDWILYYDSNMAETRDRKKFAYYRKAAYDSKGSTVWV